MILEIRIKNFLSFKDEVVFSFEATKDKEFEDRQIVEISEGVRILRLAVIYGANASGKSNLLEVFDFFDDFWLNIPDDKDDFTGAYPFLLDVATPSQPSELSLKFYIDNVKYSYSIILTKDKVFSEKLFFYPSVQPALIFERKLENEISKITFNQNKIKITQAALDEINVKCLINMSVFAAYNQVNINIHEIEQVINWMKTHYMSVIEPKTKLVSYAERLIIEDSSVKDYILNFLHMADFNISDIETEIINREIPEEILSLYVKHSSNEEKERLKVEKTIKQTKTVFKHRIVNEEGNIEYYPLPINYQSEGTLRAFGLASVINQSIKKDAFLAIDEVESSLHPKLLRFVIESFLNHKCRSQLLLTTHYDGLLEEDKLLRKDSIWFTHKKGNGSTEIFSLRDIKGVNRISSLQKAYKQGKFGAIPNID